MEKKNEFDSTVKTKFKAYVGEEPYLFVSYSHRDTDSVYTILNKLYEKKYRIWYDESCENGNDFRDELREKIRECEAVLLFVSKDSLASPFCGMEIIVAKEYNKRLYPIYLDESVEVPPTLSILLSNLHHGLYDRKNKKDDLKNLVDDLIRDLPPETMDRLTINDKNQLDKCEDNGDKIEVPEGVITIKNAAFKERVQLKYISLPETLESIGEEAFRGCRSLKEIRIPEKTLKIDGSAFRDCVNMHKLIVLNNCIKIGERAFENCSSLSEVVLPDGLTEIYGGVFNSCRSLKSIKLPDNLTILGESAFSDCDKLERVDIPQTVTKIDDLVFNACSGMKEVVLHEGLKKIGKGAFKNCESLEKIVLPMSIVQISDAPFRGCGSLTSIEIDKKNKYYKSAPIKINGNDHVLFNKNKSIIIAYPASSREVQYDIPDSVVHISDWAFSECKKLNRITIPDSVHDIGEGAFSNCKLLDEVRVPDSVTKIDDCAFRGCENLEKLVIPSSVTELGWGIFDGCEDRIMVYCDENSEIYKYCERNNIKNDRIENADND